MVLLSGLMRNAAVTGHAESIFTHVTARQGGRWAEQTVGAAVPGTRRGASAAPAPARADPAESLRELHERGMLTDSEFALASERLRA